MTTRTVDPSALNPLLQSIQEKGKLLTNGSTSQKEREALLASARELVAELETPHEVVGRMNWLDVRMIPN